jgi:hypothetical protein
MQRKLVMNIVQIAAILAVAAAMCLVAKHYIVTPFSWMRVSSTSHIHRVVLLEPSVDAEPQLKCLVAQCDLSGSQQTGTNSQEQARPQGPSLSVGTMCSYYGSTWVEIDGPLSITTLEDEGLVFTCVQ